MTILADFPISCFLVFLASARSGHCWIANAGAAVAIATADAAAFTVATTSNMLRLLL